MDTEIELKFFVSEQHVVEKITAFLQSLALPIIHNEKQLNNSYFDTETMQLRADDFGLRIRTSAGFKEQTIKTAGSCVGGLHQRPEYNVEIDDNVPNLSLFPRDIWHTWQDISQLQQQLKPIFSTNFVRHTWLIDYSPSTKIELAYDVGVIKVNEQQLPIAEIELELLAGNTEHLISLAKKLCSVIKLLPGTTSKAARGYALVAQHEILPLLSPLEVIPLNQQHSINESFTIGLQFALNQMQFALNAYVQQPCLSYLVKVTEMLALMRHGFWLYQAYLPPPMNMLRDELSYFIKQFAWVDNAIHFQELTDKTGNYRHKLEFSHQLLKQLKFERNQLPDEKKVIKIFRSARFNQLQLSILESLLAQELCHQTAAELSITVFAEQALEHNLQQIQQHLSPTTALSAEQYLQHYKLFIRSLLTGSWFGQLYEDQARLEFRDPWLDIKQGIAELQTLWIIKLHLDSLADYPVKLERWLDSKIENLLLALNHSKTSALAIRPYWH